MFFLKSLETSAESEHATTHLISEIGSRQFYLQNSTQLSGFCHRTQVLELLRRSEALNEKAFKNEYVNMLHCGGRVDLHLISEIRSRQIYLQNNTKTETCRSRIRELEVCTRNDAFHKSLDAPVKSEPAQ